MMNRFFTLLLAASCLTAVGQTEYPYPYNPDGNNDGYISLNDLLDLLSVYGSEFNAGVLATDSISAVYYTGELDYYDCASSCVALRGNWKMLDKDLVGSYKSNISDLISGVGGGGVWLDIKNAPVSYTTGSNVAQATVVYVGWDTYGRPTNASHNCFCQTRTRADIEDINVCEGLEDECGVCNGEGAIYECGCSDIPEGDCDCEGNQLDAIGVCGGDCLEDADGDGVCDPVLGPCEGQDYVTYHGYDYEIVETADGRCWLAEDLATTTFRNGSAIPTWDASSQIFPLHVDFAVSMCTTFPSETGVFYNFASVIDDRGLCPAGWGVPSVHDWNNLFGSYDASSQMILSLIDNSQVDFNVLPYDSNGQANLNLWNNKYVTWNGNLGTYTDAKVCSWTSSFLAIDRGQLLAFDAATNVPSKEIKDLGINYGMSVRCIKD